LPVPPMTAIVLMEDIKFVYKINREMLRAKRA
jgi:hypothetical protein